MVMVAQEDLLRRRVSVEEWRAVLQRSGVKYEYHDGWLLAMAGGTLDHATIAINAIRALQDALGESPCRVYSGDAAARLTPSEYRFPDVSVTCDEHDRGALTEVQSPRVVAEVLSPSTETIDRTTTFTLYRACPSIQEYVLVATDYQAVEVYRRAVPRWTYEWYGPTDRFELESIGVQLRVADLYRRTDVPQTPPQLPPPQREQVP
jgi:Uma2 family endonuclease